MQPMFTFSPDGTRIFAFSPGPGLLKSLAVLLLTLFLTVAMAIVQLGAMAMSAFNFLLTADMPVLVRFMAFLISILLVWAGMAYMKFRMEEVRRELP